jgi:hypothetical protein
VQAIRRSLYLRLLIVWCMARLPIVLTFAGLVASAAGCRPQDEIRRYTVPKQSEIDRLGGGKEATGPQRMLAAIVLRPSQGWFFKLMGPQEAVNARAEEFAGFLKSLRFQDETPAWSLPTGWEEQPGNQFRYATLKLDGTPLEVSVSTLPRGDTDETEYVLNNVNRWRGQLGLSNIAPDELQRETKQVELDGSTATLVDLLGEAKNDSMSPPFASGGRAAPPSVRGANGDAQHLNYQVPEGWREEAASGIRKASFRITQADTSGEVSVIDLDVSAADILPNVNRWRGQIELGPTTQREIDEHIQSIDVGGHEGRYIEMLGDEKATIAVIAKAAGRAWFIKLTGDRTLVEQQRDQFKGFVHSLSIGEATGATDGN